MIVLDAIRSRDNNHRSIQSWKPPLWKVLFAVFPRLLVPLHFLPPHLMHVAFRHDIEGELHVIRDLEDSDRLFAALEGLLGEFPAIAVQKHDGLNVVPFVGLQGDRDLDAPLSQGVLNDDRLYVVVDGLGLPAARLLRAVEILDLAGAAATRVRAGKRLQSLQQDTKKNRA